MNYCHFCLIERQENETAFWCNNNLRQAIETLFAPKLKLEYESSFVCCTCEETILKFFDYYRRVLENQAEFENVLKSKPIAEIKEECFLEPEESLKEEIVEDDLEDEVLIARRKRSLEKSRQRKEKKTIARNKGPTEEDQIIKEFFSLTCKECETVFDKLETLRLHMREAHATKLVIQCCSRSFLKRCHIADHAMFHMNHEKLRCPHCAKNCISRDSLKLHLSRHETYKFSCEHCDKRFHSKAGLRTHVQIHVSAEEKEKMKTHVCTICGNAYAKKSLLTFHIRQAHEKAYSCVCDICAKSFTTKMNFLTHYKTVHGNPEQNQVQCPQCGKCIANESSLRRHILYIHSPGPHRCKICNKELPTKNALRGHEEYTHQATLSFRCDFCDKAFKRAVALKEHLTTHLGGVLYTCTYCEKTFNSAANMYSHRKKMHPMEWQRDKGKRKTK